MKMTRRETLHGVAALAVAEKLTDGGFAAVTAAVPPKRTVAVLPPGAGDAAAFGRTCVACGLCQAACPEKIIRLSAAPKNFGQPVLDFANGYCLADCVACTTVCPVGALERLVPSRKAHVHLGAAAWDRTRCLRTTTGENCTACVRKCPVRALHLVKGFPFVDASVCIGCGACEHVCPARPEPAIVVTGLARQRIVRPIGSEDLVAEMRRRVASGAALVVAQKGVIVTVAGGRGLDPLVGLYDTNRAVLEGAVVFDKIVGRAAAAFYVAAKTAEVRAEVMSAEARAFLAAHGVYAEAREVVSRIANRASTGMCPMDAAVADESDPVRMIDVLRRKVETK